MACYSSSLRSARHLPLLAATLVAAVGLTGCAELSGGRTMLDRDMYEVKQKLNQSIDDDAVAQRKLDARLSTIESKVTETGEANRNLISDLEKQIRDQNEQLTAIKTRMEELTFSLEAVNKRLGGGTTTQTGATTTYGATDTGANGAGTVTDAGVAGTETPTAAVQGGSAEALIASSNRQYHLGEYAAARDGFKKALEFNPAGEQKFQALFGLADSEFSLKDYNGAITHFTEAIRTDKYNPKAWTALERMADSKSALGDIAGAKTYYEMIINGFAQYPEMAAVKAKHAALGAAPAPPAQ